MLQWLVFKKKYVYAYNICSGLLIYNEEFVVSYHSCLNQSLIQNKYDSTN